MKIFKNVLCLFLVLTMLLPHGITAFAQTKAASASDIVQTKSVDERAQELLSSMSLEEKVAQMFMVYMPSSDASNIQKKYQFGGYLLFANNFKNNSYAKKKQQIKNYQKVSKINMLIASDEEGGTVNRVSLYKQYRSSPFLSPRTLYKKGGYDRIKKDTASKAKLLLDLGINTNLAPVADVAYSSRDYIYSRSFSTNANKTAKYIKTVVTQMGKKNLVSTLKHFPGYGNNGDTHTNIIHDKRSKKTFVTRDLLPFKSGIEAGCDMIMMSHNIVECFDKKNPASLSKILHKYLREDMDFDGVIISDGLGMAGVIDFVGGSKGEAAVKAILAGNDMICANDYKTQYPAVLKAVKSGRIKESQINASVKRILKMKLKRDIIK